MAHLRNKALWTKDSYEFGARARGASGPIANRSAAGVSSHVDK
jgi:hypothetical protein